MKRYITYQASIHGGEPLGESDSLEQAVNIGVIYGCKDPGCLCESYNVFDRKLRTNNINKMFHDEQREKKKFYDEKSSKLKLAHAFDIYLQLLQIV